MQRLGGREATYSNEISCLSAIPIPEAPLSMASTYGRTPRQIHYFHHPSGFLLAVPDNGNARISPPRSELMICKQRKQALHNLQCASASSSQLDPPHPNQSENVSSSGGRGEPRAAFRIEHRASDTHLKRLCACEGPLRMQRGSSSGSREFLT